MGRYHHVENDPDFGFIVGAAVQYAMPTSSYAPELVADFVRQHWRHLSLDDRSKIRKLVKTRLQRNAIDFKEQRLIWAALLSWMEGNTR